MTVPRPLPASRRRALLAAPHVRVWTVQAVEDVRRARASGRLSGGAGECPWPADDITGRRAYAWIRARMQERIQGFSGEWPVWVWAKRPSWCRPRPGHVLLSAVVSSERVLWSDCELWHGPLNGGPLVPDEAAWDAWEAAGACPVVAERTWDVCLEVLPCTPGPWSRASGMVHG